MRPMKRRSKVVIASVIFCTLLIVLIVVINKYQPKFEVVSFTVTPEEVGPGGVVGAKVEIKNIGWAGGTITVALEAKAGSSQSAQSPISTEVTIPAGETKTITFTAPVLFWGRDNTYETFISVRGYKKWETLFRSPERKIVVNAGVRPMYYFWDSWTYISTPKTP